MKAANIIEIFESHYPLDLQEDWDHSGLQCGDVSRDIKRIYIALDCDEHTIDEAIRSHCDMIITHHPFLFKTLNLDTTTYVGRCIEKAIKNDLVIYSSHTPLDKVSMNIWLAEALGLEDIECAEASGFVQSGALPETMDFDSFITRVKGAYHIDTVHVAGHARPIRTVSICGGSGADFIGDIHTDAYITGDLKYHAGEEAYARDLVLVDIGHHAEVIMVSKVKEFLSSVCDCELIAGDAPDYYRYL